MKAIDDNVSRCRQVKDAHIKPSGVQHGLHGPRTNEILDLCCHESVCVETHLGLGSMTRGNKDVRCEQPFGL